MFSPDLSTGQLLDHLYAESSADPDFAEVMAGHDLGSEDALADLIELDGRKRIALGRAVEFGRYLGAIPDLPEKTVALDAAIDMTLRSMFTGRRPDSDPIQTLVHRYPHFESAILEAAMLGRFAPVPDEVLRGVPADLPSNLPADFGPLMADGQPRYRLEARLGDGASGVVYRAADRLLSDTDRPALVAIKLLRFRERSPWARQRFAEEATKARRISHPNIARVLDRGSTDGLTDFIVYEFVEGGDLRAWFDAQTAPVDARRAAALVARIARAVHAAHVAGLVHCDLKPANILLTGADEPKVTDFGVAVRTELPEAPPASTASRPVGSFAFMPPEQFRGEPGSLSTPADVYALGGILYFLLTGKYPNGSTPEEVRAAHDPASARPAPSARALRPEVDRDLDAICRRALAPSPDGRHGSAADLAGDLETWLRREPIYWTRPPLHRVLRLWAGRHRWSALAVAAAAASLLLGAALAGRFWLVASEQSEKARIADSRVANLREDVARTYRWLSVAKANRIVQELLPIAMVLEWTHGGVVFGDGREKQSLWSQRVQLVSRLVTEAERSGQGRSLETLMWRDALAFWLLCDHRFDEAAPLLAADLARWTEVLESDDPWLAQMRALAACAEVQRLLSSEAPPSAGPGSPLRQAESTLIASDRLLGSIGIEGTPVHQLILRTLIDLYRDGPLASEKNQRRFQTRLEKVAG